MTNQPKYPRSLANELAHYGRQLEEAEADARREDAARTERLSVLDRDVAELQAVDRACRRGAAS